MNQNVLKTHLFLIILDDESDIPECESYVLLILLQMQFTKE